MDFIYFGLLKKCSLQNEGGSFSIESSKMIIINKCKKRKETCIYKEIITLESMVLDE